RLCNSVLALISSSEWDPFTFVSRQTLDSSNRAAIPAMCGVAAEVPKKGFSKLPAPVTETPSMPAISGLLRPSSVGPWLLKYSMVELVVSRHDGLGKSGVAEACCAAAVPEQIAPTET